MNSQRPTYRAHYIGANKQSGIVLFIAIIALVVLMLAAVALVRSVNTTTIIAGNLSMKQSATISGDRGLWDGANVVTAMQAAGAALDPMVSAAHPYNVNSPATGYYSTINQINLTDSAPWALIGTAPVTDASGNQIQYIVERLCRLGTVIQSTQNCLFNIMPNPDKKIPPGTNIGLYLSGTSPIFRITARVSGAKNTLSYVQSIYY